MEREENAFNEIQHDISIVRFKKKKGSEFINTNVLCKSVTTLDHTGLHCAVC